MQSTTTSLPTSSVSQQFTLVRAHTNSPAKFFTLISVISVSFFQLPSLQAFSSGLRRTSQAGRPQTIGRGPTISSWAS